MTAECSREKMTAAQWLSFAVVLFLAFFARVYKIGMESVWYDESVTFLHLDSPSLLSFLRAEGAYDPVMLPVYYALVYVWANLGFDSVVGVRMLSVTTSTLAVAVVYFWGRRLFGHVGGLAAAMCMSFAKLQIYMGQEIRNYAVTILVTAVAMYVFHRAVQTDNRKWWAANIAMNVLVAYTHFFALLLLFAQGVYLLLTRPKRILWTTGWTAAHVPFLLLMPLWLRTMITGSMTEASWIPWAPLSRAFYAYYFVFAGSLQDAMDFIRVEPLGIPVQHVLGSAMMIAGAAFAGYCIVQYRRAADVQPGYRPATAVLLLVWLFVPPAALFILGRVVQPCFVERYVLYSATALYLIAGGAVAALPKPAWRYAGLAALAVILAANLADYPRPLRHDYQSSGAVLSAKFREGDRLFTCFDNVVLPFQYYADIPEDAIIGGENFARLGANAAINDGAAWLWFIRVPDRFEPDDVERLLEQENLESEKWVFKGRWHTYLYRIHSVES